MMDKKVTLSADAEIVENPCFLLAKSHPYAEEELQQLSVWEQRKSV